MFIKNVGGKQNIKDQTSNIRQFLSQKIPTLKQEANQLDSMHTHKPVKIDAHRVRVEQKKKQ